ncbi:hypothetical protein ACFE04_027480 [Oxalis oulophora]
MRMIDNSRWFQSKKKGTHVSMCKMFGEQEAADGYLANYVFFFLLSFARHLGKAFSRFYQAGSVSFSRHFGITHICRAIFDYGDKSSFYLKLVDMDRIEIIYEVADKMNRKKDVSTSAVSQETSSDNGFTIIDGNDSESYFDGLIFWKIQYYKGFLMSDTFGENGKPGFMKKMTATICIRMQPIYIPRRFVRIHLLSKDKTTVALMCIGDGGKVECNIRWEGASNPDNAYISDGIPLLMNLLKLDVGHTILFNLVDWEEVESLVTFVILKLNE